MSSIHMRGKLNFPLGQHFDKAEDPLTCGALTHCFEYKLTLEFNLE